MELNTGDEIAKSGSGYQFLTLSGRTTQSSFIAMEYCHIVSNRTYAVFAIDGILCGAKIAGVVAAGWHDAYFRMAHNDLLHFFDEKLQQRYGSVDPASSAFLKVNPENFQIRCDKVTKLRFNPTQKFGMAGIPHTGKLYVHTSTRRREFILLGTQDGFDLLSKLSTLCRNAVIDAYKQIR